MDNLTVALTQMGYRECNPGVWLKPVGYILFSYQVDKNRWTNWFKNVQGKLSVWESHSFDDIDKCGSFLDQLKAFETFTRTDIYVEADSHFELDALTAIL